MKRGDLACVVTEHKRRPAILINVADGWVTVVCGTSTAGRDYDCVCIGQNSIAGKVLGLSNPTYFYVNNVLLLRADAVSIKGPCPPRVFFDLEEKLRQKKSGL